MNAVQPVLVGVFIARLRVRIIVIHVIARFRILMHQQTATMQHSNVLTRVVTMKLKLLSVCLSLFNQARKQDATVINTCYKATADSGFR